MAAGSLPGVGTIGDLTSQSGGGSNTSTPSGNVSSSTSTLGSVAGGGGPTGTNPQTPTSTGNSPSTLNPNTPGGGGAPAMQELVNMRISQSPSLQVAQQDAASRLAGAGLHASYNPTAGTAPSGSGNAQQLLNDARGWVGVPYEYGGTSRQGVDCSGFTQAVYSQIGMNIGRDTTAQFQSGRVVGQDGNWNADVQQLQPGDLIFYGQPGASGPNAHVVMYVGNGQVIQAAHTGTNVAIGPLFNSASSDEPFLGVRRYLDASTTPTSPVPAGTNGLQPFGNQQQFATDLLQSLGAPQTAANINSIVNWENREGGNWHNSASYNPLNTTQQLDGSLVMGGGNSAGVQAYRNWMDGLNATIQTLKNGRYNDILNALAQGGGLSGYLPGLGTWSGGGYYSV